MGKKYIKTGKQVCPEELSNVVNLVRTRSISLRKGAASLSVSVNFLSQRVKGIVPVEGFVDKRGWATVLKIEVELQLADYLKTLAKWGYGLTRFEVLNVVGEYCKVNNITTPFKDGVPGQEWWSNFCRRTGVTLKNAEALQMSRQHNTADPFLIYNFYDLLENLAKELKIENPESAEHYWNLDECPNNHDPSKTKMVTGVEQTKVHRTIQGSGRENTTVMACVAANGKLLPPLIIFKGQNLWNVWRGNSDLPGTFYACAENGYITCDIFLDWFRKFIQTIKVRPILLLVDGHVSHQDIRTIMLAKQENIAIIKMPSHTTDVLQPLDRTCFGPYKKKLDAALISWQRSNQRSLSKSEFVDLICSIWDEGISALNIISGFRTCGIFPVCREKYPVSRLNPEKLKRYLIHKENAATVAHQETLQSTEMGASTHLMRDNADAGNVSQGAISLNNEASGGNNETSDMALVSTNTSSEDRPLSNVASVSNTTVTQTSTSSQGLTFEAILLKKIGSTSAPKNDRKQVQSEAAVLTSEEYEEKIKAREEADRKKHAKKRKQPSVAQSQKEKRKKRASEKASSSSQEEELIDDPSAVPSQDPAIYSDEQVPVPMKVKEKDYILAKYGSSKTDYVGKVANILSDIHVEVEFLRKRNTKDLYFVFPQIPDIDTIVISDIIRVLNLKSLRRGQYRFDEIVDAPNLC